MGLILKVKKEVKLLKNVKNKIIKVVQIMIKKDGKEENGMIQFITQLLDHIKNER